MHDKIVNIVHSPVILTHSQVSCDNYMISFCAGVKPSRASTLLFHASRYPKKSSFSH